MPISVRMRPSTGTSLEELEGVVTQILDDNTGMSEAGISVRSVKLDALASAEGIELFTEMFLAFSASCIVASAVLIMLLTTLRMDFRMTEIGILRALGFTKGTVGHILLVEGTIILIVGGILGSLRSWPPSWCRRPHRMHSRCCSRKRIHNGSRP